MLAVFAGFGVWVAVSTLWADSATRVWLETGRIFVYLGFFTLAAVYLTHASARRIFRYLVMGAALFILAACVWKLWSAGDVASLFFANRLSYPVSYPNNAAALFLIGFWPLIWLAAGSDERAPVRGVALGLATGLLGLAIMTQSRGAVWSLAITALAMFAISPVRLRTLLYLVVPGVLMVYEFPNLNRYWEEGPLAVGGALGARTLVVASLTAAFIGMILALLERWVKVSRRMKAIFGSVVLVGIVAGLVYGSIVATADVGGPLKWLSRTWTQFTQQPVGGATEPAVGPSSGSRLITVGSNGRVDIWRVAWEEFKAEPVTGVGADNFVFRYDQLRSSEIAKPEHPHSLFLQVLAETGIIGGILFVGSLLLSLGGLLWPRIAAGWRRSRETWLKPDRPVSRRICHPRWGADPRAYGWEIALLVALLYWLIHGSVEWLWQMAGVTVPAFLMLAAVLAEVDTRAETMWPRLAARLRLPLPDRKVESHLQPPGILSLGFRLVLIVLFLVVIATAGLPYLAIQYEESALALAKTDALGAVERAGSAHWLQVASPSPYLTQATIYENAANAAALSDRPDRHGAVLDDLALAIAACDQAVALEPADWSVRYRAGVAVLNFLLASEYAGGQAVDIDISSAQARIPGLADWSALAASGDDMAAPGASTGSLAADEDAQATARYYRGLGREQLAGATLDRLNAAKDRNPLATQTGEAARLVERILNP
ncbi:MAG: hypothetical protein A2133_09430 [Actinobacteria bacterium RBG_16_64_13]|nr:MAG: hypothetical protein A2133_09430 [Actinobacteria bacterium RBG_16_64_13]